MISMLKWLAVPFGVIAISVVFAENKWFDNGWVVAIFGLSSLMALGVWRRATYRLLPEDWYKCEDLQPTAKKKLVTISFWTMIGSLFLSASAVLVMWLLSWWDALNHSRTISFGTIIIVASFSKFGVINLQVRRLLDREIQILHSDAKPAC